jgi:hypothetical protein
MVTQVALLSFSLAMEGACEVVVAKSQALPSVACKAMGNRSRFRGVAFWVRAKLPVDVPCFVLILFFFFAFSSMLELDAS